MFHPRCEPVCGWCPSPPLPSNAPLVISSRLSSGRMGSQPALSVPRHPASLAGLSWHFPALNEPRSSAAASLVGPAGTAGARPSPPALEGNCQGWDRPILGHSQGNCPGTLLTLCAGACLGHGCPCGALSGVFYPDMACK